MIIYNENLNNLVEIFNISTKKSLPIIFPTDTIYGIGAPISSIDANEKIYEIKKRPKGKPFPILVADMEQAEIIGDFSSLTKENLDFFKENYLKYTTFIIKAKDINPYFTSNNNVAIRIPNKEVLRDALKKFGQPITATSVNESGQDFENNISNIIEKFPSLELFINGKCNLNINSSIYNLTEKYPIKIR